MPYVYIVECADGTLYTGWTVNVEQRVKVHNAGRGARYTRMHGPVKLVYVEELPDRVAAQKRELEIKRWPREKKLKLIRSLDHLIIVNCSLSSMAYNILMIAPTSFFGDYGCHVRILEEVRVLQKRGHRVTIVTYYKGRDLPELNIVRTRPTPWHADYEVGSSRHKVAFDALLSWTALRTARRLKPDIIHAHLHEGALIGRVVSALTGAPLVFDYQGSLTAEMLDHHFVRPGGKREWFFRTVENTHRSDAARDPHFVAAQRAAAARPTARSGAARGADARLRRYRFLPPAHARRSG